MENLITEMPDLDDEDYCVSYIWVNMFSCGCLIQSGPCEIFVVDEGENPAVTYISKSGKKLGINFHGPVKPRIYNGTLWIEGFVKADYCQHDAEELLMDAAYYERFKVDTTGI